jgi:hypothetical protein
MTHPVHATGATKGEPMKDGYKVFDADAHVVYPGDLWTRFLDKKYVDRVGRRQPFNDFDHYNPTTVDGRHTHHVDCGRHRCQIRRLDDQGFHR